MNRNARAMADVEDVLTAMPAVKIAIAVKRATDPAKSIGRRPTLSSRNMGGNVASQNAIWIQPATRPLVPFDKPTLVSRTMVT